MKGSHLYSRRTKQGRTSKISSERLSAGVLFCEAISRRDKLHLPFVSRLSLCFLQKNTLYMQQYVLHRVSLIMLVRMIQRLLSKWDAKQLLLPAKQDRTCILLVLWVSLSGI